MSTGNTTPEMYNDSMAAEDMPLTQEETLMKEGDILAGLLELGKEQDDAQSYRKIQIKRDGVLKLEFRIRPLSEEENQTCWRNATHYAHTKPGQPKVAVETNQARYRSYLIYTATVDADRTKVWDNKRAKDAFNIINSVEMVDKILKAGEKSRVIDIIDEISGFEDDAEDIAKN